MSTKISGDTGIDVAQLRPADGDPVAMTIAADGKVAFPAQGQSLTSNGYVRLPGGLIIQWGTIASSATAEAGQLMPVPFPNGVLSVQATPDDTLYNLTCQARVSTLDGIVVSAWLPTGRVATPIRWLAIGY